MMISLFTLYTAYLLRFNFDIPVQWFENFFSIFMTLFIFKTAALFFFNVYNTPWRFFALNSFKQIIKAHLLSYLFFITVFWIFQESYGLIPRSVIIIDLFLSIFFIGSLRVAKRIFLEGGNHGGAATLIIGADKNAEMAIRYISGQNSAFYPVALADENPEKISSYIHGIRVYDKKNLAALVKRLGITAAIISEKLPPKELDALFEELKELDVKSKSLIETNTALKVLLEKRDGDKTEFEEKLIINVNQLVEPYLEKLKNTNLDERQRALLNIVESNVKDIASPFLKSLDRQHLKLTPTEIHVAELVKQGKSAKEIADLMNLSWKTIKTHRRNIRAKLNLKNKKTNLRSYLMSYKQ